MAPSRPASRRCSRARSRRSSSSWIAWYGEVATASRLPSGEALSTTMTFDLVESGERLDARAQVRAAVVRDDDDVHAVTDRTYHGPETAI